MQAFAGMLQWGSSLTRHRQGTPLTSDDGVGATGTPACRAKSARGGAGLQAQLGGMGLAHHQVAVELHLGGMAQAAATSAFSVAAV